MSTRTFLWENKDKTKGQMDDDKKVFLQKQAVYTANWIHLSTFVHRVVVRLVPLLKRW
jgi:hypothetical protein